MIRGGAGLSGTDVPVQVTGTVLATHRWTLISFVVMRVRDRNIHKAPSQTTFSHLVPSLSIQHPWLGFYSLSLLSLLGPLIRPFLCFGSAGVKQRVQSRDEDRVIQNNTRPVVRTSRHLMSIVDPTCETFRIIQDRWMRSSPEAFQYLLSSCPFRLVLAKHSTQRILIRYQPNTRPIRRAIYT